MSNILNSSYDNQYFYPFHTYTSQFFSNSADDQRAYDSDWATPPDKGDSLAESILEDTFKLTLANRGYGNAVAGYDIVNKDAYEMIQLSLAGEMLYENSNNLVECYADENGYARFYEVGQDTASVAYLDTSTGEWNNPTAAIKVFYAIEQMQMEKKCDVVLVYGYDPPEQRLVGGSIDVLSGKTLWVEGEYLNIDCPNPEANSRRAAVEYTHKMETIMELNQDPIEIVRSDGTTVIQKVDGFVYSVQAPFFEEGSTKIEFRQNTTRYKTLPGFGELQSRQWISDKAYIPGCDMGQVPTSPGVSLGLEADEPEFRGINGVHIIGYKANQLFPDDAFDKDGNIIYKSTSFIAGIDSMVRQPYPLSDGEDYIANGGNIIFSANVNPRITSQLAGTFTFRISPSNIYDAAGNPLGADYFGNVDETIDGYLADGRPVSSQTYFSTDSFFPVGEGQSGYVVDQIVVTYEMDFPSIFVNDANGNAPLIADNISVYAYPMFVKDIGQYGAYYISSEVARRSSELSSGHGKIKSSWTQGTDAEDEDNPYQILINSMEGSDIRVSLPYLDADECEEMAEKIFDLQNEISYLTTYTCSPDSKPVLGQRVGDGVINSIEYSYQDESQYMISVQVGPIWQGLGSWDNSIRKNGTTRKEAEGVVAMAPIGRLVTVNIEGEGIMTCLNGQMQLLNDGDKVKVSIHNYPMRF